jgi:DNA-binding winged helix-turn-helix (wHTH) protein
MGKAQDLCFGALVLDETCLFARRDGETIQFTRNERALLLAFTRNPRRLMRRSRLLDEIASPESGSSDRNIDFLVNRLRIKLGDNAKSPMYIATQYGEGYVWIASASPADSIAAPSSAAPVNAFLAIVPALGPPEHRFSRQASSLIGQLRDMIADGIGAGRKVVIAGNGVPAATDRLHYLLQVSLHAESGRLNCAANLREMPSKRIVKAFGLPLDTADAAPFTSEAARVSTGVIGAVRQALADASTGLGTPIDAPPETRLQNATSLLSVSNAKWLASGEQLRIEREQNPFNADPRRNGACICLRVL